VVFSCVRLIYWGIILFVACCTLGTVVRFFALRWFLRWSDVRLRIGVIVMSDVMLVNALLIVTVFGAFVVGLLLGRLFSVRDPRGPVGKTGPAGVPGATGKPGRDGVSAGGEWPWFQPVSGEPKKAELAEIEPVSVEPVERADCSSGGSEWPPHWADWAEKSGE